MHGGRFTAAAALLLTLALAGCQKDDDGPGDGWDLVLNRIFLERMPLTDRDMVRVVGFLDKDPLGRVGVFLHASSFRAAQELVAWRRRDDRLFWVALQADTRAQARFEAWRCEGTVPEPFGLCLELRDDTKVRRYYSHEDWGIDNVLDVTRGAFDPDHVGFLPPGTDDPTVVASPF